MFRTPLPAQETGILTIGQRDIGYTIHRKKRRRRVALYFEHPDKLRLLVPVRAKSLAIHNILLSKQEWIAGKLANVRPASALTTLPQIFKNGEAVHYLGEKYVLRLTHNENTPQGCRTENGFLEINLPQSEAATTGLHYEARLEILLWYKKRAKEVLKERTDFWSRKLDLKYRRLAVGNAATQWGSCSAKNDIRYNWRVIMAPMAAIDYLVVHELCHTVEKNHSRNFWRLVINAIPECKAQRKVLHSLDAGFTM